MPPQSGFRGSKLWVNFWFMSHNFRSRYARKSFKGSKDADFGLVSKKVLSQNNGSLGCGPGPDKGGQKKRKNTPTCSGPPSEPQTENENRFFSISSRRLAESEDGLDSSLAQSGGELQRCKLAPKFWRTRDLKG